MPETHRHLPLVKRFAAQLTSNLVGATRCPGPIEIDTWVDAVECGFASEDIPVLVLEREYETKLVEPIKLRVEIEFGQLNHPAEKNVIGVEIRSPQKPVLDLRQVRELHVILSDAVEQGVHMLRVVERAASVVGMDLVVSP